MPSMVKWFLSTEEAPGVPKAFLGFLYLKKKKKDSQSQTCLLFPCSAAPDADRSEAGGFKARQCSI